MKKFGFHSQLKNYLWFEADIYGKGFEVLVSNVPIGSVDN